MVLLLRPASVMYPTDKAGWPVYKGNTDTAFCLPWARKKSSP